MSGHQDEGVARPKERAGVGGAGELPAECAVFDGVTFGRDHQLACEAGRLDPAGVVQKCHPFVVAGAAAGDVGQQHPPGVALAVEAGQQMSQRPQVAADLLQRDHVEPGDDLADGP